MPIITVQLFKSRIGADSFTKKAPGEIQQFHPTLFPGKYHQLFIRNNLLQSVA